MSIETIQIGKPIILQAVLTSDPDLIVLRGYSAYEVARRNGFEGTETEWLASLAEQATIIALGYANEAEEAKDIAVAAKDDLLPILNDMANLLAVSAKLAEIDLVEAHLSEITILSSDLDLGENSKISVLVANISSIQLLDQNIDSINLLSDDLGEGINSNIKKVSESINNVDTVAGSISNVNNVGGSIADVNAIAGKLTAVETVADDLDLDLSSKIGIVSGSIANVNNVGASIANVNSVAEKLSEVETVAGDLTNIDTVAGSISNVNNVGGSIADVNAIAGKLTAVETVADDLDLDLSSKIGIVSTNIADINTVAEANDSVNTVATSIMVVNTVATNVADINTVAGSSVKVGIVADNIGDVNLAADNIAAIQAAPTYAEEAEKWAENPEDSPVETGHYSALHHSAKASDAQTAAETARGLAEAARDKAQDWAEEDEDVEVETGQYSALHHSAKASAAQTAAEAARDEAYEVVENKIDTVDADEKMFKTLRTGATGLVTLSPTTQYYTYRLDILGNTTLNIDLLRMINQVGNARCRLIIDMPIIRTITITNPILWGSTPPTFAQAGQYIFEVIDVGGANTPLLWQVAATTKAQTTGNILYVDSTGADYTEGQINGETATRTTSAWEAPFLYLQNAINSAEAGDIIFVKAGVYKPTHLRTSPELYTDGDHLLRDATFSPKNSVDMYGGFVGTESKTWERIMDEDGYPVNPTILCGDILNEAVIDPAKTVGDPRTDLSKANASYNVVMAQGRVTNITYLNGFETRYGNANGDVSGYTNYGGGVNASSTLLVGINIKAYSNTATYGGGWRDGTNTNCTAYSNTATQEGGGWRQGTNTNCTAYSNTATYGGGWYMSTNTNCTAYSNTVTHGGGWYLGTNTNCTAYSNTASSNGGGWRNGTNTNCTAYSNRGTNGGGWNGGTNTNCTAYSNTGTNGGGWRDGTNTNCTGINNKGAEAVNGSTSSDTHINCLLFNNRNVSGTVVGFSDATATGVKIFRNNAYDTEHPTITGGAGSDIDYNTCIPNATLEQIKIEVPTVIGPATTEAELQELHEYRENILTKLRPKEGSVLKGAGVNNTTYPNPTDFEGAERPENSTIGILEGE